MAAAGEPTLGEIGRTVARIEKNQIELSHKIDTLPFVTTEVWAVEKDRIDGDITGLGVRLEAMVGAVAKDLAATKESISSWTRSIAVALLVQVAALIGGVILFVLVHR